MLIVSCYVLFTVSKTHHLDPKEQIITTFYSFIDFFNEITPSLTKLHNLYIHNHKKSSGVIS